MSDTEKAPSPPPRYVAVTHRGNEISQTFVVEETTTVAEIFRTVNDSLLGMISHSGECRRITLHVDELTMPPSKLFPESA